MPCHPFLEIQSSRSTLSFSISWHDVFLRLLSERMQKDVSIASMVEVPYPIAFWLKFSYAPSKIPVHVFA